MEQLKILQRAIIKYEKKLFEAMHADFNKSPFESYATEVGQVLEELRFHLKYIKKWSKKKKVPSPIVHFRSHSYLLPEPYGLSLIIAPWNYPFNLLIMPLIGSMSAGNCTVLKPANYSENTSRVIEEMITKYFDPGYISIFQGGRDVNQKLLDETYDYIFFTGSPALGRIVMEKASKNLTPVTLELGGKSPCIIDNETNIKLSTFRSVWGKFVNGGQTCIAPDYFFIHESVKDEFVKFAEEIINNFFNNEPGKSKDYPRMINDSHFQKVAGFLRDEHIIFGGELLKEERYISPTIVDNISKNSPLLKEEIFGPIIPIIPYNDLDEVIDYINKNPKPLALYFFSNNKQKQRKILTKTSSGGVCLNDTLIHVANPNLPFGGVGNSGMGQYHGKASFETFSHLKPILRKTTKFDIKLRYPPYKDKIKLIKKLLK